jgi:O-acetyl-ADP-ribose deacetylase (regulator of RNase III)
LPLQTSYGATEAAKRTAAAGVSAELRDLTQRLTGGDAGATPKPADVRRAAKEREVHSAPPARPASVRERVRQLEVLPRGKLPTYTQFTSSADTNSAAAETGGRQPPVFRAQPKASTSNSQNSVPQMPVIFEHRGTKFEIMMGDITKQCVDAIVNPAHKALVAGSGVSKMLADAAGAVYRRECAEHVRRQGRLEVTECCVTGAGDLTAYFVIHAVAARLADYDNEESLREAMLATYWNVYETAARLALNSLALPLLGGVEIPIGITAKTAATVTMLAVDDVDNQLELVRFVLPDASCVSAFQQAFADLGLTRTAPKPDAAKQVILTDWNNAAEVDRVLRSYIQENAPAAAGQDLVVLAEAPSAAGARHVTLDKLQHDLAAAQAKLALFKASSRPDVKPAASVFEGSEADTHISSVSEWAAQSNCSLLKGEITDVTQGVDVSRGRKVKVVQDARDKGTPVQYVTRKRSRTPTRCVGAPSTATDQTRTSRSNTSKFEFRPKSYNGNQLVERYLSQFRWGAESARWPREEWGVRLITALEGKALRVVSESRLPSNAKPSFEVVADLLRETFASDASPDVWLTTLENKRRNNGESLTDLSQTVMELMAKALPELKMSERQRVAVGYFARALSPALRRHTLAARPPTLKEALQVALAYENASKFDDIEELRKSKNAKVRAVKADEDDQESEQDAAAVYAIQASGPNEPGQQVGSQPRPLNMPLICQLCGKRGHSARDCWGRSGGVNQAAVDTEREGRLIRLEKSLEAMNA